MNGTIPLPRDAARKFKQEYSSGLVRPQVTVLAGNSDIMSVALANDSNNSIYEYSAGEFITVAERKRREAEREQATVEEMVSVPAGCFSSEGRQTCLDPFRIGKYEVTQRHWKQIMGTTPSKYDRCGDDCPVENVSWNDVQEFIHKLNSQTGKQYRLPTEAEWHYACTCGGKNEEYCGGNNVDAVAWYDKNSGSKTHLVGAKQPNGLGVYDMSGNVWEWVNDLYGSNYPSGTRNPIGASSGSFRAFRGGSLSNGERFVRAATRQFNEPGFRSYYLGFRLAAPTVP